MRKLIAVACMMCAILGANAQFVDVTTIDVQTETNKIKVVEKEKPVDKTIRPKGFIGSVGYNFEVIPVLIRPDEFVALKKTASLQSLCIELGYQVTPQFGFTAEFTNGCGKEPFVYLSENNGSKEGVLLNSYYYCSPKLADGLYIGAGLGYVGRSVFDYSKGRINQNVQEYYYGKCSWSGVDLEAKAGYAWKYIKVEGNIDFFELHYWFEDGGYCDINKGKLEVSCGLKASLYFNSGYFKLRKKTKI